VPHKAFLLLIEFQNVDIGSSKPENQPVISAADAARQFSTAKLEYSIMLFLVVSTPRPERPSDLVGTRQSFWPWIGGYQARGVCRHIYARAGRGAVAVFDVEDNDALHRILNEWADIIPAQLDTYPLIEADAAQRMLAAQATARNG
jgi:hypothetical protein